VATMGVVTLTVTGLEVEVGDHRARMPLLWVIAEAVEVGREAFELEKA
jgi:hypothetical protein